MIKDFYRLIEISTIVNQMKFLEFELTTSIDLIAWIFITIACVINFLQTHTIMEIIGLSKTEYDKCKITGKYNITITRNSQFIPIIFSFVRTSEL